MALNVKPYCAYQSDGHSRINNVLAVIWQKYLAKHQHTIQIICRFVNLDLVVSDSKRTV